MMDAKVGDILANLKQSSGVNVFLLKDAIPNPVMASDSLRRALEYISEKMKESLIVCFETVSAPAGFDKLILREISRIDIEEPMCPVYLLHPSTTRILQSAVS
jgi:hypothetical protein